LQTNHVVFCFFLFQTQCMK